MHVDVFLTMLFLVPSPFSLVLCFMLCLYRISNSFLHQSSTARVLPMGCLFFDSFAEFNVFVTFVVLGMSIMMTISAVNGAPSFVTSYYQYATGKPDAECENPIFWDNANTFFSLGTYTTQILCEGFTLLPSVRRIPLRHRMIAGLLLPLGELLTLILVPAFTISSQSGAIGVLMTVSIVDGVSKALADSTTHALAGPFPTQFFNGEQWGLATASLAMSILSVILKVSMATDFDSVNTQARIYFGIAIAMQLFTITEFILMMHNPFAHQYVAEFRMMHGKGVAPMEPLTEEAEGEIQEGDDEEAEVQSGGKNLHPEEEDGTERVKDVLHAKGDADGMIDRDQTGTLTSADQMVQASACEVIKKIYPLLIACFYCFFTTLMLWPGVFFHAYDGDMEWYTTIIVLLFNLGDFSARIVLMVPALRPTPMVCIIGCAARTVFIPILVLCVRGIIHNEILPYIMVALFGLSGGYFGAMATVYCPRTPTLSTAGERSLAGIIAGLFLEAGLAVGANFAALINGIFIPNSLK